jgi:UDP-3-O-[3-hydroxymyristoyl] N-acetylglucosamine deacetylase
LRQAVGLAGIGLHSGATVSLMLRPAPADHGIVFQRSDIPGPAGRIPARWDMVSGARLCTRIGTAAGASVATVEHLMAALAGTGVHNALVEIDGPEVPILDGSAAPFARAILAAGRAAQGVPVRVLRILEPVEVADGMARARLEPAEGLQIVFAIDFPAPAVGRQARALDLANGAFLRELADSRTFAMAAEIAGLRAAGLVRGGSLENAVVFDGDRVLTPGGLRHPDEPVRHKMLDALGDLALAGGPVIGRYTGQRAGHALTNALLRAVFARPAAHVWTTLSPEAAWRLPGAGVTAADLPTAA